MELTLLSFPRDRAVTGQSMEGIYTGNQQCQWHHTFEYETGEVGSGAVSYEQLQRLAVVARANRNFQTRTISCDDDGQAYPGGHWMAVETAADSNSWNQVDCTGGDGGGGHAAGQATANNGGCCDFDASNVDTYETWPLPNRICASINTGGGVAFAFSTSDLRIH